MTKGQTEKLYDKINILKGGEKTRDREGMRERKCDEIIPRKKKANKIQTETGKRQGKILSVADDSQDMMIVKVNKRERETHTN